VRLCQELESSDWQPTSLRNASEALLDELHISKLELHTLKRVSVTLVLRLSVFHVNHDELVTNERAGTMFIG
jgi:hypothetical protein